jgi:uncharacterized protein YndB with AHSA1/START domain
VRSLVASASLSYDARVPRHRLTAFANAPIEVVFDLWTNLERMKEWIGGVTGVSDVTGPMTQAGTRYVVHFGPVKSPSEVLAVEPPRHIRTRFGSWVLRGTNSTTFTPEGAGTRIDEEIQTVGWFSEITSRLFSMGSYKGSYQGELNAFAKLAEQEARKPG